MRSIETLPGEPNSSMISSIINLVCPECGGHMMNYQCCGRCGRNWLPEWEWPSTPPEGLISPEQKVAGRLVESNT